MSATLEVNSAPDGVRVLTFSNPHKRNAVDAVLLEQLAEALSTNDPVRAWVVKSATPSIFSAGFDLKALPGNDPHRLPDDRLSEVLGQLARHPAPSIALVTGAAIGAGCELSVACDFRVGSVGASFSMPPARLGVVYSLDGIARLVSRVGRPLAHELLLTGRRLDATEAHQRHLLTRLSDTAELAELAALDFAHSLAALAPLALKGLKRGLQLIDTATLSAEERNEYEQLRRQSFESADAKEGVAAAIEKRTPHFTGR